MAYLSAFAQAIINEGPLLLLVVLLFVAGARRAWIFGRELDRADKLLTDERIDFMRQLNEMREERDSWRRSSMMLQGQRGPTSPPPNPLEGD